MQSEKLPENILKACNRMQKLCDEARKLRDNVENWCRENGIDTYSDEWYKSVRDEIGGCDAVLDPDAIEHLLTEERA